MHHLSILYVLSLKVFIKDISPRSFSTCWLKSKTGYKTSKKRNLITIFNLCRNQIQKLLLFFDENVSSYSKGKKKIRMNRILFSAK
jgi:hypothetical protein